MKSTHEGVLLMPADLLKVTLLHECFSRFLNFTSGTISRSASQGELTLLEKKSVVIQSSLFSNKCDV